MINHSAVLNALQAACIADATILSKLGLTGATAIVKAQGIIKTSQYQDLAGGKARLCIFTLPARTTGSSLIMEDIIEIDCHVPAGGNSMYAYDVQDRLFTLLHEKVFAYHRFYYLGTLGELPTADNYVCVGARFRFYPTTKNAS